MLAGPAAVLTGKAGTYYANAPVGCLWWRDDVHENDLGWGQAQAAGRQIVTIKSTDYWFITSGCGSWIPLLKLTTPASSFGNGMQWTGVTVQPGRYVTSGASSCRFEFWAGFGGSEAEWLSGYEGPLDAGTYVDLDSTFKGLASYNCGTWTRIGNVPPSGP